MKIRTGWLWCLILVGACGVVGAAEWSGIGGGPNRSGLAATPIDLPPAVAWIYRVDSAEPVVSSPAVGPDGVYFCAGARIRAVDPASGTLRWEYDFPDLVSASPTVAAGRVFVGTEGGKMYALDARTGENLWSYDTESTIHSSACIVGPAVIFGADNGNLYALNAQDGGFISAYRTPGPVYSSPAYGDDTIVAVAKDAVLALRLSPEGLTKRWSRGLTSGVTMATPAIAGEKILVGTGSVLSAFSTQTGNLRWTKPTGGRVTGTPAVAGDQVLFGSQDGVVYCVSLGNGKEIWSHKLDLPIKSAPVIVGNAAFVRCRSGVMFGLDLSRAGQVIWQFKVSEIPEEALPGARGGMFGVPSMGVPGTSRSGSSRSRRGRSAYGSVTGGYGSRAGTPGAYGGYGGYSRVGGGGGVEREFTEEVESSPAVGDGVLYIQGGNGDLYSLTAWAADVRAPVFSNAYVFIPRVDKSHEALQVPVVNMGGPTDYDVQSPTPVGGEPPIYVQLKVEDEETGVDPSTVQVSVQGPPVDVSKEYFPQEQTVQVKLSPPPGTGTFLNGEYALYLSAKDFGGREGQAVVSFTVDRKVPQPDATGAGYGVPGAAGGLPFLP